MTEQDWRLEWGNLLLAAPSDEPIDTDWKIETAGGSDFGNPQPLVELLRSLLTDGSVAVKHGFDNRTVTLHVQIHAVDGEALAQAEAALMAEQLADDPAPLVWVPPVNGSAPCVFDVVTANLDRGYPEVWDRLERKRGQRFYTLTLSCLPWARTEDPTIMEALPAAPASPTTVSIDTCDSTTGWAADFTPVSEWSGTSLTATGLGYIQAAGAWDAFPAGNIGNIILTRTGVVTMGATPYLVVDVTTQAADPGVKAARYYAKFDAGAKVSPVAKINGTNGRTLLYFRPPESFTTAKFYSEYEAKAVSVHDAAFRIHDVSRTDAIAVSGSTARQASREVEVLGSAPTTAGLRLYTDEAADTLGRQVLVYTRPGGDGFQPPLRRWLSSSGTVDTDATLISGARNTLNSAMSFLIPADQLEAATYALLVRLSKATTGTYTINWSAKITDLAGADVFGSETIASSSAPIANLAPAYGYSIRPLAAVTLPPIELDDPAAYAVKITLSMDADGADTTIDEAWLCDVDNGALTVVDLPATAAVSWLEIRSPELDSPRPAVFVGTGGSDLEGGVEVSRYAAGFGVHRFLPGTMQVFTACSGSVHSQSEIEFYLRAHSHVVFGSDELP